MLSAAKESGIGYIHDRTSLLTCECFLLDRALSMVTTSGIPYSDDGMTALVFEGSASESMSPEVKHFQTNKRDDGKNTPDSACFVLDENLSPLRIFQMATLTIA
jgi:hypothetical protein